MAADNKLPTVDDEGRTVHYYYRYYPPGVKQALASGTSAWIGEVDDSTVFKYPLAPGGDMARLDVERKLLEIIGPHQRIIGLKGFSDTGIYLERAVNGTVAKYIVESGKLPPSLRQRMPTNLLLDEGLHIKLSDFQGKQLSEESEVLLDGWSGEPCRFYCPRDDPFDADVKTDLLALGCTIYFIMMGHAVWYEKVGDRFASQQFPQDQHACSAITLKCWQKEYESAQEVVRDIESLEREW
ncbi:hypothetical protein BDV96DRAFT_617909 [Lophiotrema nucula]|uniref:Protein kinase domain-containing protein n=1 Tax=Lophiotrema nucula TaxID=690887 RepID=A0A6A5YFY0_9PLEO|nr:hypothetical protein BDV96DRAFT_617909 [Lophiotrema nucula]